MKKYKRPVSFVTRGQRYKFKSNHRQHGKANESTKRCRVGLLNADTIIHKNTGNDYPLQTNCDVETICPLGETIPDFHSLSKEKPLTDGVADEPSPSLDVPVNPSSHDSIREMRRASDGMETCKNCNEEIVKYFRGRDTIWKHKDSKRRFCNINPLFTLKATPQTPQDKTSKVGLEDGRERPLDTTGGLHSAEMPKNKPVETNNQGGM